MLAFSLPGTCPEARRKPAVGVQTCRNLDARNADMLELLRWLPAGRPLAAAPACVAILPATAPPHAPAAVPAQALPVFRRAARRPGSAGAAPGQQAWQAARPGAPPQPLALPPLPPPPPWAAHLRRPPLLPPRPPLLPHLGRGWLRGRPPPLLPSATLGAVPGSEHPPPRALQQGRRDRQGWAGETVKVRQEGVGNGGNTGTSRQGCGHSKAA